MYIDLCHSGDTPRNSEGSFIKLSDGRIMMVYTRCREKAEPITAALICQPLFQLTTASPVMTAEKGRNPASFSI